MHRWGLFVIGVGLWAQEERVRPTAPPVSPKLEAPASITLQGKVLSEQDEPLPGAYVKVAGTVQGTVVQLDGSFRLTLLKPSDPFTLEVSFVGYETQTLSLRLQEAGKPLTIRLRETGVRAQEVVISASRVSETVMQSPVTVLKMSAREIGEAPGINFFQNITFLKGVEQVSSSLTFQVINTRGFNSTTNPRFVQRLDGIEMQAPALNFPIAVISNSGDLDVESIELLPGPASALYGPNAFSGILNVHTKDPFRFPGFSSLVRLGVNHVDGRDTTPRPLYEIALRYAKAWNNRLGFKVFANWFSAHDWMAQNGTDMGLYGGALGAYAIPGPNNPGYDAVNRYGDEARIDPATVRAIATQLGLVLGGGPPDNPDDLNFYLARTGYWEREIVQYDARVGKLYGGLYYRLSDRLQLSYNAFLSTGATIYQGPNRFSLRDFLFTVNKLEASGPNFRVWGYALLENSGNSFDSRFAALNLLSSVKPHINWLAQYVLTYTGQMRRIAQTAGLDPDAVGIPQGGNHAAARAFADSDRAQALEEPLRLIGSSFAYLMQGGARPQPGTEEFRRRLREVIGRSNFAQGGAAFYDRSAIYHLEGQYDLTPHLRWIQVLVGGNYRYFLMNSKGTIFADTAGPIGVDEYGIFLQATKPLWAERLRLQGSLRYDKNRNFRGNLTPRLAFLVAIDPKKQHIFRVAYQVGFRMPTLQAQYIDLEVGRFRYIGALEQFTQAYGVKDNNYSAESVQAFRDSLANRTRGSSNPNDYADLLRTLPMGEIKPEKVASFEVGTRHLIGDRLFIDIDYAYSRFTNFMATVDFYGPRRFRQPDGSWYVGRLTPDSVAAGAYTPYRRFFNTSTPVYTHHLALTLQYSLTRQLFLNGNFTYAEIILSEEAKLDKLLANFNTPRYKANLYLTARELLPSRRLGFAVGYRWINAYLFEESFYSQIIPTYQLVDLQLSYRLPKLHSTFRIGGQNVLNNRHIEVPGGPVLGALYYFQWIYDPFGS